ncbi:MAG: hypothetical protein O3C43_13345 [Verrucomicrobia bacterium]|nr:hypothetical protein [Verrucomicrobiota bacterium]MDA1067478.1 hypothetical protein [Verrucomicrobiota bacterium]
MSYLAKKNRSFTRRCFIKFQNVIMFCLTFTLLLLLTGLGLSIYYDEIPVPQRILEIVNAKIKEQGLTLKYEKIILDFRGDLLIKKARLSFDKSGETALEVDQLYLDINYASLFLGRIPLNNLELDNARIYYPAIVSPTGTNQRMLDKVNLALSRRWTKWNLKYLTAKIQHLDIVASGDLSALFAILGQTKPKEKTKDPYLQYLQIARSVSDQSKFLDMFDAPKVEIIFNSPSKAEFSAEIITHIEGFEIDEMPEVQGIRAQTKLQLLPELQFQEALQLSANSIDQQEQQVTVQQVELSAFNNQVFRGIQSVFPLKVELTTGPIDIQGTKIDQAVFTGKILNQNEVEGTLLVSLYEGVLEAAVNGNWKEQTGEGSLSGFINLERIFDRPEFDHLWKLRWSKQHKPVYLDVVFSYPGKLENAAATFRVETRDIDIIKTPFQWARARGTLAGTTVDVYQLEGGGNGNDLLCTFVQDLKNPFYRFTMAGRFRPHDIDVWWRDWWKKTFDYLEIKGELPWMDMSIRNTFKFKKQLTLFGYSEAENVNLKGMHFDKASAKMFIRPNYIDVLELNLERQEGKATGELQRHLETSKLKNVIVDIDSNLDLELSMNLFGENGLKIIEPYTWTANPGLSIVGEFNFENDSNWQDLLIEIETDQSMTFYDFPFDSLEVKCHYDHGDVLLDTINFGFAGGKGEGEASYLKQNDLSFLLFDFDIVDAELKESLIRLATVKGPKPESIENSAAPKSKLDSLQGKLNIHASGISPAGSGLDRVMAKGNIEITEGNLAQIPLFGPLSALMPFTKLHLTTAKSFFAWDEGKMTFPDLVMTGSTARLEGVGDFYTGSSDLDFQVRVMLLRETDIPLISNIIMPIFDPVSKMAAVNLKGSLSNPQWRFAMSPLNFFDSKPDESNKDTKTELLDFEFRK